MVIFLRVFGDSSAIIHEGENPRGKEGSTRRKWAQVGLAATVR